MHFDLLQMLPAFFFLRFIFLRILAVVDPRKSCSSSQPKIVACPICGETVAGQRFAPHLEKCINGGKRGGGLPKKSSLPSKGSSQSAGFHLPYYTAPRKIDPHPSSLVIRIRLKDGGKTHPWFHYLLLLWNYFWSSGAQLRFIIRFDDIDVTVW